MDAPTPEFPKDMPGLLKAAFRHITPARSEALWKRARGITGMKLTDLPKETFGLYAV